MQHIEAKRVVKSRSILFVSAKLLLCPMSFEIINRTILIAHAIYIIRVDNHTHGRGAYDE